MAQLYNPTQALAPFSGVGGSLATGMGAGNQANFDASQVTGMIPQGQMVIDPRQQMQMQQAAAQEELARQQNANAQTLGLTAGVGNAAANANTQRQLAVNAQANAANAAMNQLNALGQARATNANTIQSAAQTAASMFR